MSDSVYGFGDVSLTVSHDKKGQYVANGTGLVSVSTSMATDRSTHDVAADGSVMTSKIKGRNGSHAIVVQQTSAFDRWLTDLYKYLEGAPVSEWAGITVVIKVPGINNTITSTGVSFQKLPDRPYQAQGQQITWNFMCQDIQQDAV